MTLFVKKECVNDGCNNSQNNLKVASVNKVNEKTASICEIVQMYLRFNGGS